MSYHKRLNPNSIFTTGPQRVTDLKGRLEAERKVYRESPRDSYNRNIAERNIADLERLLEQAERNEAARAEHLQRLQAQKDETNARIEERRQQEAAKLKDDLRTRYKMADRTATDEDFERAYPSLLEDHRRARMAEDEEARRRMARSIRF